MQNVVWKKTRHITLNMPTPKSNIVEAAYSGNAFVSPSRYREDGQI